MEKANNLNFKNFVTGYSLEVMPKTAAKIESFSDILPRNTRVYLAHLKNEDIEPMIATAKRLKDCLLYTSPSPRDRTRSRMPSSA